MTQFRVQHDFTKSQPRFNGNDKALFGERNEGFLIEGPDARTAVANWNARQLPGEQRNPFYLKVTAL